MQPQNYRIQFLCQLTTTVASSTGPPTSIHRHPGGMSSAYESNLDRSDSQHLPRYHLRQTRNYMQSANASKECPKWFPCNPHISLQLCIARLSPAACVQTHSCMCLRPQSPQNLGTSWVGTKFDPRAHMEKNGISEGDRGC